MHKTYSPHIPSILIYIIVTTTIIINHCWNSLSIAYSLPICNCLLVISVCIRIRLLWVGSIYSYGGILVIMSCGVMMMSVKLMKIFIYYYCCLCCCYYYLLRPFCVMSRIVLLLCMGLLYWMGFILVVSRNLSYCVLVYLGFFTLSSLLLFKILLFFYLQLLYY